MLQNIMIVIASIIVLYIGGGYLWNKKWRPRQLKSGRPTRAWNKLVSDVFKVVFIDDKDGYDKMPEKLAKIITPKKTYIALLALGVAALVMSKMAAAITFLAVLFILIVGRAKTIIGIRDSRLTRMFDVANSTFKYGKGAELNPWAYVRVKKWQEKNIPGDTIITFPAAWRNNIASNREGFESHFNGAVAEFNSWVYEWSGSEGTVTATPVEPLPTMAKYPGSTHLPWSQIPLGIGPSGEIVWDVTQAPHILVCGGTGGGKSVLQRNILFHCIQHSDDWQFLGVDVKMVELPPFAKYTQTVAGIAADVRDGLEIVRFAEEKMMERYAMMKEYQVNEFKKLPERPRAIMVMIDETYSFLAATGAKNDEGKEIDENKAEATILLGNIARLGRAAGVHLVIATQRPDATVIPGELKENLAVRYAAGILRTNASLMVLDSNSGTEVPDIKGRGVISIHGAESPIQGYFAGEDWADKWIEENANAALALNDGYDESPNLESPESVGGSLNQDGKYPAETWSDLQEPTADNRHDDAPAPAHAPVQAPASSVGIPAAQTQGVSQPEGEDRPVLSHGTQVRQPKMTDEWDEGMEEIFRYVQNLADVKPPVVKRPKAQLPGPDSGMRPPSSSPRSLPTRPVSANNV